MPVRIDVGTIDCTPVSWGAVPARCLPVRGSMPCVMAYAKHVFPAIAGMPCQWVTTTLAQQRMRWASKPSLALAAPCARLHRRDVRADAMLDDVHSATVRALSSGPRSPGVHGRSRVRSILATTGSQLCGASSRRRHCPTTSPWRTMGKTCRCRMRLPAK